MARYSNTVIFEDWAEVSSELTAKLRIYGVERCNVNAKEVSIIGKGHPQMWKLISMEPGQELADFEGIDDETKKICHLFTMEQSTDLIKEALGYGGTFEEVNGKVMYIRDDSLNCEVNDACSEILEEAMELLSDDALIEGLEYLIRLAQALGNNNLVHEMQLKLNDIM